MKQTSVIKKALIFIAVLVLCSGIVLFVSFSEPPEEADTHHDNAPVIGMPITVRSVNASAYPAHIVSLGEVVPRYSSHLKAQVSGQVEFLSDRLVTGGKVRSGEILVRLEQSQFKVQVAEAESRLKTARLALLKEEREAEVARSNWQQSGIKEPPSSKLVLRQPHVDAARSAVIAAEAALKNTVIQLGHTEIKMPYDGVIMTRSVNPWESVLTGDEIAVVYSRDAVEVGVQLDAAQWSLLSQPIHGATAHLTDPLQQASWDAIVVRGNMHFNRQTRQRTLVLEIRHPLRQNPPLLPGTFVHVSLTGRQIPELLRIPEIAQTKEGQVWLVDGHNRLRSHRSVPVFYGNGEVFIGKPESVSDTVRVAISPSSGFINGLLVQPKEDKDN